MLVLFDPVGTGRFKDLQQHFVIWKMTYPIVEPSLTQPYLLLAIALPAPVKA